jgi:hypothetical protein
MYDCRIYSNSRIDVSRKYDIVTAENVFRTSEAEQ